MLNTPNIRFKGFTEPWEQRKLNEIAEKVTEKNKNNIYNEPLTNSAEMGIISQRDYFDREVVNEENLDGYYVVKDGDFVYNPRVSATAPVGPINCNRLGRNGVMSPLYTVFRTHDVNNLYLEYYFKTTNWHEFMKLNGDSGARFDRFTIATSQFMEMPILYPDIKDQIKIGQYLDSFDHLITLHQRKCDEMSGLKKFMLQKMFPKNGEQFPEIRFNGYTEPWKQRKLGDFSDIKTGPFGSTLHADDYVKDGMPIITTEHFRSGQLPEVKDGIPQVSDDDYFRLSNYTLKTDDIVFSRVGSVDINALVTTFQDKWLFSGRVLRVRPYAEVDSVFLHTLLETDNTRNDIISRAVGQTMPSINTEILKITSLCLPQDIDEQREIGKFFRNLDHLITLHQRKCDEFKEIKKYMLQNMFPQKG